MGVQPDLGERVCIARNPKNFTSPDTNTTAVAAMAIVAAGGRFSHSPVTFFQDSQESNGSFGVYGVSGDGQQGDPDSTAYVIQALVALTALATSNLPATGLRPNRLSPGSSTAVRRR